MARFGNSYEAFISDAAFRDSVSMNILQIGELSNKLSEEFRDSTKRRVPRKQIYDMRNRFAHGYGIMDSKIIWEVATVNIPDLIFFCESFLI
ncbi:MAG: DUF86 domain-containing protein [Oscillospiraceae bacterium]|nr:DUF86 domain-containing protein [Oscillospiraceae bacterium]